MTIQPFNIYPCLTPVRVAATSNQSGSYYNGISGNGVGATFRRLSLGQLIIDGVSVENGDDVLLSAQTNGNENGIYVVVNSGSAGSFALLQRRNDFQCIEQVKSGLVVNVGEGTANKGTSFCIAGPVPNIFGIDDLEFVQTGSGGGGGGGVTEDQVQASAFNVSDDSGIANAYIGTYNPSISAYTSGMTLILDNILNDNTGVSTFDAGAGPVEIVSSDLGSMVGGEIFTGNTYTFTYSPVYNRFIIQNSTLEVYATELQNQDFTFVTAVSTSPNVYTLTLFPKLQLYRSGQCISFAVDATNTNDGTGSFATIDIDGLGPLILVQSIGSGSGVAPLFANALMLNINYKGMVDPTLQYFIILNPSSNITSFDLISQTYNYALDSGVADAYVVSLPSMIFSGTDITSNAKITVTFANTNTGPSTITVNGVVTSVTVPIVTQGGRSLIAGEIQANGIYELQLNFANQFVLLNPEPVVLSNVTASGSPVSFTVNTSTDLASLSLPTGLWTVWGNITYLTMGTVPTQISGWVSSTSATLPDVSLVNSAAVGAVTSNLGLSAPSRQFNLLVPSSIFISGLITGTSGSGNVCGAIYAKRA